MIIADDLHKTYGKGINATPALRGVTIRVNSGEFVAIMGRSGSGKSTLLHLLGLLDSPTSGNIIIDDQAVLKLSAEDQAHIRLSQLGYVFQEFSLISELTVLENVFIPAVCLGSSLDYKLRAREILERVGLSRRLKHYPNEISGGEQQRVAIARALINEPKIIFADEPTASLDSASSRVVLELFRKLNKEHQQTIVMVTHEPEDKNYVDRVIWLKDGLVDNSSAAGN